MAANVRASVCGFRRPSMENRIIFPQHLNEVDENGLICVRTCAFGILVLVFIGCMILFTSWLNTMEGKTNDSLNIPAAGLFFLAAAICGVYILYKECSSHCRRKPEVLIPSE